MAELKERIGADEFCRWKGFFLLEPWGCEVEDWRAAVGPMVAAQVASKKGRRVKQEDFVPSRYKSRRAGDRQILAALGGLIGDESAG